MVRAGALGDLLLLRPALAALSTAGWSLELLAPAGPAALLVGPEACVAWESSGVAALVGGGAAPAAIERRLAGLEAVLAFTRSSELIAALRRRAGRVDAWDPLPPPDVHAADWALRAAAPLGAVPAAPVPLDPGPAAGAEARPWADRLAPGYLALHPGSGSPSKNWPAARFAELARALSEGRPWLLLEGPADGDAARPLAAIPGAVRAREVPLPVLAALLAGAGLYVGNDSGVSHLAAAVGAPTLALFGPTDPDAWRPVGPAVRVLRGPGGALSRLEVAPVLEAAEALRRP